MVKQVSKSSLKRLNYWTDDAPHPAPSRRRTGLQYEPMQPTACDRLSALPEEIFANILQYTVSEPVANVRLQRVNRRFCRTLRGDVFWQHVSPQMRGAPQSPAAASSEFICSAEASLDAAAQTAINRSDFASRQTLYWQFQRRTSLSPFGLSRRHQRLLLDLWTRTRPLIWSLPSNAGYDLARAAAGYVGYSAPADAYTAFGDDANMMRDLAPRGPSYLGKLSPRLAADISFRTYAIFAHIDNYSVFADRLVGDEAFYITILRKHGSLLPLMPEPIRANRDHTLLALNTWDDSNLVQSPSFSLLASVDETLRKDPEIVYTCVRRCANSFIYAALEDPDGPWRKDKDLVRVALHPSLYTRPFSRSWATPTQVFGVVHEELYSDAYIALCAVRLDARNYARVHPRWRHHVVWCNQAIAANYKVAFELDYAPRHSLDLVKSLTPQNQLACLFALRETIGQRKDMFFALLRNTQLRQTFNFSEVLSADRSIYCRVHVQLSQQVDVMREILNFDGREIAFFSSAWRQNADMYNYASCALLGQLRMPQRRQSLRRTAAASPRRQSPLGHPALGIFDRDPRFAKLFLLSMPELDDYFAPRVRGQVDIVHLARLGTLLQEESGTYTTLGGAPSVIKQLTSGLRRRPDDFVSYVALSAFYMIRGDWVLAQHWLGSMTTRARAIATLGQQRAYQWLVENMPVELPARGDDWYQRMMMMVSCCHLRILQQADLADHRDLLFA